MLKPTRAILVCILLASAEAGLASTLSLRGGSVTSEAKAQRSAFSLALEDLQSNTKDLLFTEVC